MDRLCLCAVVCVLAVPAATEGAGEGPQPTNHLAVGVRGGVGVANALAAKYGCTNEGQVGNLKDVYHFVLPAQSSRTRGRGRGRAEVLNELSASLGLEGNVGFVEQQVLRAHVRRLYSPPSDPLWQQQWSLLNTGQTLSSERGRDINVEPVWLQGITGCNSSVAIVDDGVDYNHGDLQEQYISYLGWDYLDGDNNPFPEMYSSGLYDDHGTRCAGEVAMVKSNAKCGVGVAFNAGITSIRILGSTDPTDVQEASALGHHGDAIHVYSCSWGPSDSGRVVLGPGPLLQKTFENGAASGRGGKGSIWVWAAGNGGSSDSCAADGYVSSVYTIAVGSASSNGYAAAYDEQCSSKMATVFVDNVYNSLLVSTTDPLGECTSRFGGTSAAAPMAAGVIALVLEANPELTWRDVQYLIAYTSNPDPFLSKTTAGWVTNGGGLLVSHAFGFGAIDAEALVTRARHWVLVPGQEKATVSVASFNINPGSKHTSTITYSGSQSQSDSSGPIGVVFLEHVVLTATVSVRGVEGTSVVYTYTYTVDPDSNRGDAQIELRSPSGTRSVLLPFRDRDEEVSEGYHDWPFMSLHYWGENPAGDWQLDVTFRGQAGYLEVTKASIAFYGTSEVPEAVARVPSTCDPACARPGGCAAPGPAYCDACSATDGYYRDSSTLECVTACKSLNHSVVNGYCYNSSLPEPVCSLPPSPPPATSSAATSTSVYQHTSSTDSCLEPAGCVCLWTMLLHLLITIFHW